MDGLRGYYAKLSKSMKGSQPRDPNPGIESRSSAMQANSLPAEPQGKPKNTGVGSLSLLQQIFPNQELNQGVSCIAGGFFTNWAIREAQISHAEKDKYYRISQMQKLKLKKKKRTEKTKFIDTQTTLAVAGVEGVGRRRRNVWVG